MFLLTTIVTRNIYHCDNATLNQMQFIFCFIVINVHYIFLKTFLTSSNYAHVFVWFQIKIDSVYSCHCCCCWLFALSVRKCFSLLFSGALSDPRSRQQACCHSDRGRKEEYIAETRIDWRLLHGAVGHVPFLTNAAFYSVLQ